MGARGPIRKADAIRQDHHKDRAGRALTVVAAPAVPPPPDGLLPHVVELWEAFWHSDVAAAAGQPVHRAALEEWIRAIDERERVGPTFRKKRIVVGSQGQPVLNPLAGYLKDLNHTIDTAEAKFGMNPKAAASLGLTAAQAQITALDLNRMLERGDRDVIDGTAEWADGYEDA